MEIAGQLTEFPLPELLQFLDCRQVTGYLSLSISSDYYEDLKPQQYMLWFNQGHVVSADQTSSFQDIYAAAVRREWIRPFVANKLKRRAPENMAAGIYLETQGVLNFGQLRSLFFSDVVNRTEALCSIKSAIFWFQTTIDLPMHEMTGLRIPAGKIALLSGSTFKDYSTIETTTFCL